MASSYNIPNPSRQSRQDRPDRASGLLPKRTKNTPKDPANQPPSASSEPVRMPENQVSLPLRAYKTQRETSFTTYANQCKYNYSTRSQTSKRHPNPRLPLHKLQIQHPSNRRLHHLPGKRTLRSLVSSHHFRFRGKCRCQMGNDGQSFLVE